MGGDRFFIDTCSGIHIIQYVLNNQIYKEPDFNRGEGYEMKKKESASCFSASAEGTCRVESLISVDDRGQMVLPKELRERGNIRAGDKLAVITWEKDGEICCFTLIKADHLAERVKDFLGPVMKATLR